MKELNEELMVLLREKEFSFGEIVYLKTDTEQKPRIVVSFIISEKEILYQVRSVDWVTDHYAFELSKEKNVELALDIK